MKVINFVLWDICSHVYSRLALSKFRQYIKKNIWLDNLPGVLDLSSL